MIAAVLLPAVALECTPTSCAAEDKLRQTITIMVPNSSPPGDLERAHRMTNTIVDVLYMVPLDVLNSSATPQFISIICEAYWPDRVPEDD